MKKLFGIIALLVVSLTLVACGTLTENTVESATPVSFVAIDINPSVEFIVDEDDVVLEAIAANDEAEGLLEDLELVGLPVEEALDAYLEAALDAGYLDANAEDNVVVITTDEPDAEEGLKERLRERAETFFGARGIGVGIILETMDDELLEQAQDYNLGIGRLRMIQRALDLDEDLTIEEALELSPGEIMRNIMGSGENMRGPFNRENNPGNRLREFFQRR